MAVESVNALNAAAAAESECAKLRRLLEEERKLVQRHIQEKEDEAQMAKRKIERMSQRLAEAQKDVEYATARADVAENGWTKVKREVKEKEELIELLNLENQEMRQITTGQVQEISKELEDARNDAGIVQNGWTKVKREVTEKEELIELLNLENQEMRQITTGHVQEISQELEDARNDAGIAQNEWTKVKREVKEKEELIELLNLEIQEMRQITTRQVQEISKELQDARNDAGIAQNEWTKVKREVKEKKELIKHLKLEIQEMRQITTRQVQEISKELEDARKDADIAQNGWTKVKREVKEKEELIELLNLEIQEMRQITTRQVQEISKELEDARNDAGIAQNEWTKVKREVKEKRELIKHLKLEIQEMRQITTRQVQEKSKELEDARKDADVAQNGWTKVKREVEKKEELIELLNLEIQEMRQITTRQVQEISKELEDARNDAGIAQNGWTKVKREVKEKKELIKHLKLEIQEMRQITTRQIQKISKELEDARKDADIGQNGWTKVKREVKEKEELIELLNLEIQEMRRITTRQVQEISKELEDARNDAGIAQNEWSKVKREVKEKKELIKHLKLEIQEMRQITTRQVQEISKELEDARKDADVAQNGWTKVKREVNDNEELIELLNLEIQEMRQITARQVQEISKELQDARNDAGIAQNEWTKVKREVKEKKELIKHLKLEIQEMRQITTGQVQEISKELEDARNDAGIAQNGWTKVKREVKEKEELIELLNLEIQEMRQITTRQVQEISKELEDARNDAGIAQNEWTKVKGEVKEKKELIKHLKLEIQELRQITTGQVQEISKELEDARNDAGIAQNGWTMVKREVKEKEELIELVKLEIQEMRQIITRQVQEISQELEDARNNACIAQNEWTKVKREVKEKEELIKLLKLEIKEMRQITTRQVQEISQELEDARKEAEHARNDADIAQNEWIKAKKDLQVKLELIQMLKLECQETSERAMRKVEEKELELADALNAVTSASSSSSVSQDCAICLTNEKDMAFGCGHMTCEECGMMLSTCPICREDITNRIKLFP